MGNRGLVVDIQILADAMRLVLEQWQYGGIIGFDVGVLKFGNAGGGPAVDGGHNLGQRRPDDALAGTRQAFGHLFNVGIEERLALGAHGLAEIGGGDRRFIGDAEPEIALGFRRPMKQHRAHGQFGRH